jgi:hypothetical protein
MSLVVTPVFAMKEGQVQTLPGSALLDLRVDAVLQQCGLPALIEDSAAPTTPRQQLQWGAIPMKLSTQAWSLYYSRDHVANTAAAWRNTQAGSVDCLTGLSQLVVTTQGEAGFLTVKKRPDNNGYITTYTVPDDLFNAHKVVGILGHWAQGKTAADIRATYGKPDEILQMAEGNRYRYWIVKRDNKMPLSVLAVDFDISGPAHSCKKFAVYTTGTEFVQQKFDALTDEWQRVYVLD